MAAGKPVLDIQGLSVRLPSGSDRAFAVENLSLSVDPGEVVCVVGESGSGKSVTAFSVMGLLPPELVPTSGRILLEGADLLSKASAELRRMRGQRMAMVFQEPMTALNPVMRVGKQIDEVLEIHTNLNKQARRSRVLDIMTAVRLPDPERLIDLYPHQLSGGQRQRIMIAAALVLDPVLLVADEPTTALDVTTQAQILQLIRELQQHRNTGVLFITHDLAVVAEMADRVVVMQHGRVVEQGPATEILRQPRADYTRMLIRAVPSLHPPVRSPVTEARAVLETKGLGKTYAVGRVLASRQIPAAKEVNLTVRRGETVGVVGESGSGKSTVARCIARLIEPTEGAILIDGEDVARLGTRALRPYRKRVQMIFQDPYRSLNPRRTVGDSMVEGPLNFGVAPLVAQERARKLMELIGFDHTALGRFPHQFSGGQRQRICLARALAVQPEILIADEAVSALDVSVQAQVLGLIDDARRQFNLAVLFITHDLRVAAQICDRIVVMHRGLVVEEGVTRQVFNTPCHAYTRALLDAAPGRNFVFGAHDVHTGG